VAASHPWVRPHRNIFRGVSAGWKAMPTYNFFKASVLLGSTISPEQIICPTRRRAIEGEWGRDSLWYGRRSSCSSRRNPAKSGELKPTSSHQAKIRNNATAEGLQRENPRSTTASPAFTCCIGSGILARCKIPRLWEMVFTGQ
jgi:hypothetical protein